MYVCVYMCVCMYVYLFAIRNQRGECPILVDIERVHMLESGLTKNFILSPLYKKMYLFNGIIAHVWLTVYMSGDLDSCLYPLWTQNLAKKTFTTNNIKIKCLCLLQ